VLGPATLTHKPLCISLGRDLAPVLAAALAASHTSTLPLALLTYVTESGFREPALLSRKATEIYLFRGRKETKTATLNSLI